MKNMMQKAALNFVLLFILGIALNAGDKDTLRIEALSYEDYEPVIITIADGKIVQIKHTQDEIAEPGVFVSPGLIDIQINGYMGVDFGGAGLTIEGVRKATRELWKEGVTSFLPTVTTDDYEQLLQSFTVLSGALQDPEIGPSIPGFHLEGPFISPVKGYRGAHLEKYVRKPDWQEFQKLQAAANQGIKLVTVAPEMEGAIPFISHCVESGVVVSLGHHNGSSEQIREAVDAGASLSTHLGNGCANEINRHLNPLWPQLADDRLSIDIICDGHHLTKDEVKTFFKVKGVAGTILVSDAVDLAGLPPGKYFSGEREVLLTPYVVKFPSENVLAGAASPLSLGLENMIRFTQCSLRDAVHMASTNPARLLQLDDLGEIRQGKRADLILFTLDHGEIVIRKTIVAGKIVYSRD